VGRSAAPAGHADGAGDTARAVDVRYVVAPGADGGVPIVLIHGVGSNLESWDRVVAAIGERRTVVRYDLRGHGRSPAPGGRWSVDDFVADHCRLLDRLGVEKADTVGFSLGGLIAQRIAATRADLVRRLVVIGAVAGRTESEREAVLERLAAVEHAGPGPIARQSVRRWYTEQYLAQHPEVEAETVARMSALDPIAYANAYRVLATTDLVEDLDKINAPVLAMTGENDVGSPPRMSQLIAERTGGRLKILPGVRHEVLEECPNTIAEEISSHVR
jgi:pimeloyl-ACP methyl ester carboxylesterase